MHHISLRTALAVAAAALLPAAASAQTVTATPGTEHVVAGPVQETATGASMTGMRVTATFADAVTLTGAWGALGTSVFGVPDYGVIFGDRLQVSHLDNDTFPLTPWYLRKLGGARVTSLTFDGAPGNTGFDRAFGFLGLQEGTPGSGVGVDYADLNLFWNGSSALYSNILSVAPNAPLGDLYRTLTISFAQDLPSAPLTGGREVYFRMDTDRVGPSVVPEPSTYVLMGTGLAGLLAAARRRRRA